MSLIEAVKNSVTGLYDLPTNKPAKWEHRFKKGIKYAQKRATGTHMSLDWLILEVIAYVVYKAYGSMCPFPPSISLIFILLVLD